MGDIQNFTETIVTFRKQRNWEKRHTPKDSLLALFCEVAELAEHFKWHTSEEMKDYIKNHKSEISEELCDALFWILLISHDCNIDLVEEFPRKMKKNEEKYSVKDK